MAAPPPFAALSEGLLVDRNGQVVVTMLGEWVLCFGAAQQS